MKKSGIACLFVAAMCGIYYLSYTVSKEYFKAEEIGSQQEDLPTQNVNLNQEAIISNLTEIVMETYDIDTKTLREETLKTPLEYLGLTRTNLIVKLQEYLSKPSDLDRERGLIAFELASFSTDKVILRKSYSENGLLQIYYIFEENGYLIIYLEDKKTLYDYTDIPLTMLPESVRTEVNKGKKINSQRELYDFLEAYSS